MHRTARLEIRDIFHGFWTPLDIRSSATPFVRFCRSKNPGSLSCMVLAMPAARKISKPTGSSSLGPDETRTVGKGSF